MQKIKFWHKSTNPEFCMERSDDVDYVIDMVTKVIKKGVKVVVFHDDGSETVINKQD
jgi:hypothetical protein